ncbi:GNAT family N-acetyltransferase [Acinetobacter nematophilus]|uniref:N-acetyltransferase n=1 Tax=Acinetobacter nematophilus TaxID=2994642 RepID=A0A9X3IHP7_9GAMM|nr:N-acetyltransferase [Acinetobacter nematophilus]MCX5467544.1 N-acetyltransferase [Acinetobacter nematophilus]
MLNLTLRNEQADDIESIFNITQSAFEHAAHTDHTEQLIVNALRKANQLSISIVAELDDKIIGHIAISPVVISSGEQNWYGLGPVSVVPAYQQQGVGKALIQQSLHQLKQQGAAGCVVLGDPAYYSKFGFKPYPNLILENVPAEYFQTLAFTPVIPHGTVKYHSAFEVTASP